MRSLYWKIFLSFWLATILIILCTAWLTSEIAQKSSIPARERVFMDSYANAAIATLESGQKNALKKWLEQTGTSKHLTLFLITNSGEIIGSEEPPDIVKKITTNMGSSELYSGLLKFGNVIVSHVIVSTSGKAYRLVAISNKPLSQFIEIPWSGLTLRLPIAIIISGIICYLLSLYLTKPLRSLRLAAKSIATGVLSTRVGHMAGHRHDEIAELSDEFDRMAEQLESLIASKERLLRDISHELRSPLARLQIAIELGRKKASEKLEPEFSRMEIECFRLNNLIGEIIKFARMDKSTAQLTKKQVNLPVLIDQIIEDANFEINEKEPVVFFHQRCDCTLLLDERLIHRAIENIIRNALRYSAPHPKIDVSLSYDEAKKVFYVDIKDNGPGVPETELDKLFNPFYRVDSSRAKHTGGYGLGLAIAMQAIRLHHGEIHASNCEGGGLQVRISLPGAE